MSTRVLLTNADIDDLLRHPEDVCAKLVEWLALPGCDLAEYRYFVETLALLVANPPSASTVVPQALVRSLARALSRRRSDIGLNFTASFGVCLRLLDYGNTRLGRRYETALLSRVPGLTDLFPREERAQAILSQVRACLRRHENGRSSPRLLLILERLSEVEPEKLRRDDRRAYYACRSELFRQLAEAVPQPGSSTVVEQLQCALLQILAGQDEEAAPACGSLIDEIMSKLLRADGDTSGRACSVRRLFVALLQRRWVQDPSRILSQVAEYTDRTAGGVDAFSPAVDTLSGYVLSDLAWMRPEQLAEVDALVWRLGAPLPWYTAKVEERLCELAQSRTGETLMWMVRPYVRRRVVPTAFLSNVSQRIIDSPASFSLFQLGAITDGLAELNVCSAELARVVIEHGLRNRTQLRRSTMIDFVRAATLTGQRHLARELLSVALEELMWSGQSDFGDGELRQLYRLGLVLDYSFDEAMVRRMKLALAARARESNTVSRSEKRLRQELGIIGVTCETQVSLFGFSVDMLVHPRESDRIPLVVESDGSLFHMVRRTDGTQSPCGQDRLRDMIFAHMGVPVLRVSGDALSEHLRNGTLPGGSLLERRLAELGY